MLWILVNIALLMLTSTVLVLGISFFWRNRHGKSNIKYYILAMAISSGIWCGVYGIMGIDDNLTRVATIRVLGVLAIDAFLFTEFVLFSKMSLLNKKHRIVSFTVTGIFSLIDWIIFSNAKADTFYRIGNWTTWGANPEFSSLRFIHSAFVMYSFFNLFFIGVYWARKNNLRRQKNFIRMSFFANFILIFLTVPDTLMPILKGVSVPTSGMGAALCTIVIWHAATRLNAFDIQVGNIVHTLFNFVDVGVIVFDTNHISAMLNDHAVNVLNATKTDTRFLQDYFLLDENEADNLFDSSLNHISATNAIDKEKRIFNLRMSAVKDTYGDPYCYLCVFIDVTNELELIDKLEAANNSKAQFLMSISHEIRTPINTVIGLNEMVARKSDNEEILDYTSYISRAAHHLLAIINELLDITKASSGKMHIQPEEYRASNLLRDIYVLNSQNAKEKGLEFEIINDERIPSVLLGDALRIQQVATNIISNAIKYTKQGKVTVKIGFESITNNICVLIFKVSDTGIGIKKENIPHLFDAFERFDGPDKKYIEGTGVGLTLVKELLRLMDGSIDVESEVGKGSTFTVTIPQKVVSKEPIGELKDYLNFDKKKDIAAYIAPDARILLVDDNEMNRVVFKEIVHGLKIGVDEAVNGLEALDMIKNKAYDIIFMDHLMPELDGVATLSKMKEDKAHKNQDTPVIVMTANAMRGAKEEYLSEGFADFLAKPFEVIELETMIRRFLPEEKIVASLNDDMLTMGIAEEGTDEKTSDLPEIEGVKWEEALRNVPNEKLLPDLLKTFCKAGAGEVSNLSEYYTAAFNGDEEKYSEYRILIHAMKNSAALIGALELSEKAKALETAVKDGNITYLENNHEAFCNEYLNLINEIKTKVLKQAPDDKLLSYERLGKIIGKAEKAMEEYDTLSLNDLMLKLSGYKVDSAVMNDEISNLVEAVKVFDKEAFNQAIYNIRNYFENQ